MLAAWTAVLLTVLTRGAKSQLSLGVLGAWTALEPDLLVAIVAAHLDFWKNWDDSLVARLGPPIVPIPHGVHPNATNISLRIGTTHAQQDVGVATALDMMFGLDGAPPVIGLIGASLSSVTMPIATMSAVQQVPQVSFSATSFALSNKDSYPFFLRTAPPDNIQARALWRWILQFEIPLATCVYTTESYGLGLYTFLKELAQADGRQDQVQGQGLRDMQAFNTEEARAVARTAQQMGSRFIILLLSYSMASDFMTVLHEEGMLGPGWQIVGSDTANGAYHILPVGFMIFYSAGKGVKFPDFQLLWSLLGAQDIIGTESRERYKFLNMHQPGTCFHPAVVAADPRTIGRKVCPG